jgi:hypothetical protein
VAAWRSLALAFRPVIGEVAGKYGLPGRDLNLLAQDAGATHMMGEGAVPREAPKAPKFVGEHFGEVTPADTVAAPLSQEFRANPLTPAAAEKVAAIPQNPLTSTAPASPVPTMTVRPPSAVAPQGGDETASGPRSVGAAASRDMTAPEVIEAKTPAQAARDLDTSVRQTAADRAGPQGVDNESTFQVLSGRWRRASFHLRTHATRRRCGRKILSLTSRCALRINPTTTRWLIITTIMLAMPYP